MTESEPQNDKYINRIRALLDKAEATDFPEEAEALREKAFTLMGKWQVEEWQLDEARAARGETRVNKIVTRVFTSTSEFRRDFLMMLGEMGDVLGARAVYYGFSKKSNWTSHFEDGRPALKIQMVGYEMDLDFLNMLYAQLMLEAAATLEAKPNPRLSFDENVYRLHESAVQWERIRILMNRAQEAGAPWKRIPGAYAYTDDDGKFHPGASDGGVMRNACRRWCEEIGVEYHSIVNGKRYRASYVHGFTQRVVQRFREMHRKSVAGTGIELYDRNKKVRDEFDQMFPGLKPMDDFSGGRMLDEAISRGRQAADRADLSRVGSKMGTTSRPSLQ